MSAKLAEAITATAVIVLCGRRWLAHDIAAGPVEIPPLTQELRGHLAGLGRPQLLLRLGRPQQPSRPGRLMRLRISFP
jgi:hypothetical protein